MEDSQKVQDRKDLDELIKQAEDAGEPGTTEGEIVHRGSEEIPAPMVTSSVTSAGYVYIYDTRTGERSKTNRNMVPMQLKKKRPDGSFVFTTRKPDFEPKRGTFKCMLHKDDPKRSLYDELGLPVCAKETLNSQFQVTRHMQKRHKDEWSVIEEYRKKSKEDRDEEEGRLEREFRTALIKKIAEED